MELDFLVQLSPNSFTDQISIAEWPYILCRYAVPANESYLPRHAPKQYVVRFKRLRCYKFSLIPNSDTIICCVAHRGQLAQIGYWLHAH
jgi:hypothetical protein